jgi:protein-tyrosine phosphatase
LALTGYVDIHAHVLPGIDDGPATLPDSVALAKAAAGAGTASIAATPHVRSDFPAVRVHELAERCAEVRAALAREDVAIELVSGAEVSLMWAIDASDEELRLATYGQRGTDLLVETPPGPVFALEHLLYDLHARGVRVTLAHPERSIDFQHEMGPLRELVRQGVLLQLNADSLLGRRSGVRRLAEQLCREGPVHAIASDGHRAQSWRPVTKLAQGVQVLSALVGPDRALWMATTVPKVIVDGSALPTAPALVGKRSRTWLFNRS